MLKQLSNALQSIKPQVFIRIFKKRTFGNTNAKELDVTTLEIIYSQNSEKTFANDKKERQNLSSYKAKFIIL